MPQRMKTAPRKRPRQVRSEATVQALLKGTARVLIRDGYDRASTNRIAVEAGVAIGSLYQYFPSKEALVAALIERHCEDIVGVFTGAMARLGGAPLRTVVAESIRALIAVKRLNPRLHAVLIEQVPRVGRLRMVNDFHDQITALVRVFLEQRRAEVKAIDLDLAAFVTVEAVHGVIHSTRDAIGNWDESEVAAALTDLVYGYLTSPPAVPAAGLKLL